MFARTKISREAHTPATATHADITQYAPQPGDLTIEIESEAFDPTHTLIEQELNVIDKNVVSQLRKQGFRAYINPKLVNAVPKQMTRAEFLSEPSVIKTLNLKHYNSISAPREIFIGLVLASIVALSWKFYQWDQAKKRDEFWVKYYSQEEPPTAYAKMFRAEENEE
eukprot:GEZU01003540.1.p1 GENE.GEZU01003540.1~~GEZU01003540.1.p1  ORF type:complete len:167 (-),score=58.36 GEZU01003540.1:189-689(-)